MLEYTKFNLHEDYKVFMPLVERKSDYTIYHDSYTKCIDEMREFVKKNGFFLDENQVFNMVHDKKPSNGKTSRLFLLLYKHDGTPAKRGVAFQIYRDSGRVRTTYNPTDGHKEVGGNDYELNMYLTPVKEKDYVGHETIREDTHIFLNSKNR